MTKQDGQGSVEITEAMMEAGLDAYFEASRWFNFQEFPEEWEKENLVKQIYLAMQREAGKPAVQTTHSDEKPASL